MILCAAVAVLGLAAFAATAQANDKDAHKKFMFAAVAEAKESLKPGVGKPFGAVVVKDGTIVAAGHNEVGLLHSPTAHAEMTAIAVAAQKLKTSSLEGCVIYASGQPCPMCLAAIRVAGIRTLYYANNYEQARVLGFKAETLVPSLCAAFGAKGADINAFLSTPQLEIIHMPLPEAAALYDSYKK